MRMRSEVRFGVPGLGGLAGEKTPGGMARRWVAPYTVYDTDNYGRAAGVASYTGVPTWTTVFDDKDYADTIATNRRALTKAALDELGRVCRTEVWEISTSDGSKGKRLVTDYYFDRNSHLAGT